MTKQLARATLGWAVLIVSLYIGGLVVLPKALAAEAPYGGCREVMQDWPSLIQTPAADDCREMGWTIRPRLVTNPHGVVLLDHLPSCRTEDSSYLCMWNAQRDGNGVGNSFWVDRKERRHFVWSSHPTGQRQPGDTRYWHWVDPLLVQEWVPFVVTVKCIRTVYADGPTSPVKMDVRCPDGRTHTVTFPDYNEE